MARLIHSDCCGDPLQTDEGTFHPWLKTWDEARAAVASGKPVYCSGCGKEVDVPAPDPYNKVAAMREP